MMLNYPRVKVIYELSFETKEELWNAVDELEKLEEENIPGLELMIAIPELFKIYLKKTEPISAGIDFEDFAEDLKKKLKARKVEYYIGKQEHMAYF